ICASVVMPFWISRWGGIRNGVVFVPMLLLIYYQWNRKKAFLAMAGVTAALSFYVSQEMGVLAVLLFIVSAAYRLLYDPLSRRDVTACMKEAAIFIGSFGGSLLGLYGYLMMNGARLENIGISLFSMPREFLRYYKNPPRFAFPGAEASLLDIVNFIKAPTFDFFFTPVIYALGSLYLFRKRKAFDRSDFTLMLFTVYGWCMFIIGIRGFSGPQITGPQFNFALVTVIVMELFLIQKLIDRARAVSVIPAKKNDASSRISRTRALALAVLVALFAVYTRTPSAYSGYLTKNLTFPGVEARVSSLPGLGGAIVPPAQESTMSRVCDFIMKHTGPDDYIYAFPHEPQYYFFSRRRCPTLFTNALDAGIDPRYERAAIADIERKNVTYAIFVSDSYSVMDNAMIPNEKRIPLIYAFFQERYAPVNVIDGTVIMKKREVRR
ncbi:MAG: hypothetical protein WCG78_05795, partial [Candidatus Omnitrophota bacterium]